MNGDFVLETLYAVFLPSFQFQRLRPTTANMLAETVRTKSRQLLYLQAFWPQLSPRVFLNGGQAPTLSSELHEHPLKAEAFGGRQLQSHGSPSLDENCSSFLSPSALLLVAARFWAFAATLINFTKCLPMTVTWQATTLRSYQNDGDPATLSCKQLLMQNCWL